MVIIVIMVIKVIMAIKKHKLPRIQELLALSCQVPWLASQGPITGVNKNKGVIGFRV